ncbi:MAG TPA: GAF domain-containing protein, partial [Terriglobales bacterium]|nr:GAF domain-containing protein [Terriglobales bacterium]
MLEGANARSEDSFQRLLLKFSAAAAEGTDPAALIRLFCTATREFFQVDGAYYWQCVSKDELVGAEADGLMAEGFRGARLTADQSAVAADAVRKRKTVFLNHVDPSRYTLAAEFHAKSLMSAPLIVSNEVVGAAVFIQTSDTVFTEDDAAKATILAGQLGSLLEANRLTQVSREEHRRAEILAEVAQALHSVPDATAVVEAVADRLRVLLRTRLVSILLREGANFELSAVSAESAQMATSVRARHDRKGLQFSSHLAARAVAAGEPITVAIESATNTLGELVPSGSLIAAPFRTSRTQGAVLVYPRQDSPFSAEEKSLVASVAGFGAVAIANAELYSTAREQAQELHQLLEISSELGSIGDLDKFLQRFSLRASDFLGFSRAFIGMLEEDGAFHVHWGADHGKTVLVDLVFPKGAASTALLNKEVFWSDDPQKIPGANLEVIREFDIHQILTVPLVGGDGQVFGMFGVLDRRDEVGISPEDVRRARALATQVSVALQVTRNLHLSEQHRRRASSLMALVLDLNAQVRLPEFAKSFVNRAAEMMGARVASLAMRRDSEFEIIALQEGGGVLNRERSLLNGLGQAFAQALQTDSQPILFGDSASIL